ncbi:MAG: GNAT family N-acetyltransferase [Anaerolineae bacterium]|nr:GNAT family N-acetyltransferase [Anaerolineae bacterium]
MDNTTLPDAPDIPRLAFRSFRGESDFPRMVAVFEASREVDRFDWVITVDDVRREFDHLHNCDPVQDMLVAEIDGQMIAYSRVWWDQESEGDRVYTFIGLLVPEWRRKGIGTAMIRHGERRLREIASQHPANLPKYLQRGVVDSEVGLETLLQNEGYEPVRYGFSMVCPITHPLPEAPMPAGLEVRPVREKEARKIIVASDEAFRDHWGHRPITENNIQEWMADPRFDPSLWKVAWDGDEIAGGVLGFVDRTENEQYNRKRGYTEDIWVRRPWRRRGLARSLLVQSIQMFADMGMQETALGVDVQNPHGALRLYESVGYQVDRRDTTYRKPLT